MKLQFKSVYFLGGSFNRCAAFRPLLAALCFYRCSLSIKNSSPFRTGFSIGAAIGFLGYFLQIDAESTPFSEALLNALGFAVVLGLFIGLGFSGAAGKTHSHAAQHTDERDHDKYSKKHPPITNVVDDKNET